MLETGLFLLTVAGQALAIYVFLVVALARVGRWLLAGLTPFNYLIVALLGSAVESGLYRGSSSLWAGLVSAVTIILADQAMASAVNRWPRLRRWLVGGPVVLVHNGQLIPAHLQHVRLTEDDLAAAIRRRGFEMHDVRLAVMECNGEVGIVPLDRSARR